MNTRPALISYKNRDTGKQEFLRPDIVNRIVDLGNDSSGLILIEGDPIYASDKPFAIAERIRAAEGVAASPEKPAPPSYRTSSGKPFDITVSHSLTGAWLSLKGVSSGDGTHTLGLIAQGLKGYEQDYIQYRDGTSRTYPRFALSVNSADRAEVQVLIPGEDSESRRLRTIDLKTLIGLIEKHTIPDRTFDKPAAQ